MDGHGGKETSEFIKENLWRIFSGEIGKYSPVKAFKTTVQILNSLTEKNYSGSTLSAVWIPKEEFIAYACILGDSSVVVKSGKGKIWISPDHNVRSNSAEAKECEKRGGEIYDGYVCNEEGRGVQLSRALGDEYMGKILNKEPEIFKIPITKGTIILVASDGVFDPEHMDTEEQANRLILQNYSAMQIVNDAIKRKTRDNVSAILCSL
jgi:serine/threonine protein phosphatase PrpC